jgi:hypothetical protein
VWNGEKQKYRPVVDATASGLNETLVPLDCEYVALSDVVKPHTPACLSGFDLKDAFLLWPRSQHSCDLLCIKVRKVGNSCKLLGTNRVSPVREGYVVQFVSALGLQIV